MIKTIHTSKEYLTTTEASKVCHVTRFTIRNWVNNGRLKSYKTAGGHRRIYSEDLVKFVEINGIAGLIAAYEIEPVQPPQENIQKPESQIKQKKKKRGLHKGLYLSGKYVASLKNLLKGRKKSQQEYSKVS